MTLRRPSVFGGAIAGSISTSFGLRNFVSSSRPCPSGVRIITMSTWTPSSPLTRSTHGPSTGASPSSVMPSAVKKAIAAARSSTTTLTWSNLLIVMSLVWSPEGGWAHVRAIRQVVSMERLHEVLLEPGDGLRDLLARGSRGDEAPELRAVWTCQQADGDFLLDQRRQPGNQCRFVQQRDQPDQRIEQGGVECLERDGLRDVVARRHRGTSISDAICTMERTSRASIMPRNGSRTLAR